MLERFATEVWTLDVKRLTFSYGCDDPFDSLDRKYPYDLPR
ncbi:hypothetical protein J2Y68_001886 [Paenarthrobacter nitroguajacolicus]|nr:hypothetical protein [Paenarthrobacter nitroguajacolicus]